MAFPISFHQRIRDVKRSWHGPICLTFKVTEMNENNLLIYYLIKNLSIL
jgi:hypothetical protein